MLALEFPAASREKVANVLLGRGGRGGAGAVAEDIARAAVQVRERERELREGCVGERESEVRQGGERAAEAGGDEEERGRWDIENPLINFD